MNIYEFLHRRSIDVQLVHFVPEEVLFVAYSLISAPKVPQIAFMSNNFMYTQQHFYVFLGIYTQIQLGQKFYFSFSSKSLFQEGNEIILQVHSSTPEVYQCLQDLWDVADGHSVGQMKIKVLDVRDKVSLL